MEPDTAAAYHRPRLLVVFVDGVGLAPAGPHNPLASEPTPALRRLLGGPLTRERVGLVGDRLTLSALDATLGVAGLPQSATGQSALFTGVNTARLLGRHVSAFPGPRLRAVLRRHGLLARAAAGGGGVTFANAYSHRYLAALEGGGERRSVTTCLTQYAGLEFRDEVDLAAGRAVSWDIARDHFAARTGADLEPIAPHTAGRHLAAIAGRHRLTLFETFLTDLAGHRRLGLTAGDALARVDGLLGGVLAAAPADLTLLVTSDHGNVEDGTVRQHTRNPVPLLAAGPLAPAFAGLDSIVEVTPAVLDCLGSGAGSVPRRAPT